MARTKGQENAKKQSASKSQASKSQVSKAMGSKGQRPQGSKTVSFEDERRTKQRHESQTTMSGRPVVPNPKFRISEPDPSAQRKRKEAPGKGKAPVSQPSDSETESDEIPAFSPRGYGEISRVNDVGPSTPPENFITSALVPLANIYKNSMDQRIYQEQRLYLDLDALRLRDGVDLSSYLKTYQSWLSIRLPFCDSVVRNFLGNMHLVGVISKGKGKKRKQADETESEPEICTSVRGKKIYISAAQINAWLGYENPPPRERRAYSMTDARRILAPGVTITTTEFVPSQMHDVYRVIWYVFSRMMQFKSHNYTHFVLRDIQPMVDLVERRTIDVGGYIFDELRHFMSSRKGCRMNLGSLISFILRENGIWYLEDGEPVVTPTRFDAGHIHNMGLDLPLNMEERTYSMKRKKGASQAGSVPAEPSVAAGAGTSRAPRPRSPQTPPSARHGEDEQSSAPHHRTSPGRFPITREYLRSMISEVLTPMIRDMTETIITSSSERVITTLTQRLPSMIADALSRTHPQSSQPTDPSDSHIHTDSPSHEPETHTGPSSELPTEPSTDPSPEQPHDPDTTTQPDPQPSTAPIPEPEEPAHVSDQSFSFADIADIAREVVGDDHGPTPEVPATGVVPPTVPPTEPAPESSRPSSPSLGFVSTEIPPSDTRDFDHHVIQATPLQTIPPVAPSSVQPASSSSGQPISIRDSSSSSPSDFEVDKKGENSCDDSYEGSE